MQASRVQATLIGGTIALMLTGCATHSPEPSSSVPQTPPPVASITTPTPTPQTTGVGTDVDVETMREVWEQATPDQRESALREIGLDPADPQPTEEAVSALVSKAAEFGYVVTEDAARAFLDQIANR